MAIRILDSGFQLAPRSALEATDLTAPTREVYRSYQIRRSEFSAFPPRFGFASDVVVGNSAGDSDISATNLPQRKRAAISDDS